MNTIIESNPHVNWNNAREEALQYHETGPTGSRVGFIPPPPVPPTEHDLLKKACWAMLEKCAEATPDKDRWSWAEPTLQQISDLIGFR